MVYATYVSSGVFHKRKLYHLSAVNIEYYEGSGQKFRDSLARAYSVPRYSLALLITLLLIIANNL